MINIAAFWSQFQAGLAASVIFSHHEFLDVLPDGASKGNAMHYLARRWGLAMDRILVAGDSGNDADMLRGGAQAVVVANHSSELRQLKGRRSVTAVRRLRKRPLRREKSLDGPLQSGSS